MIMCISRGQRRGIIGSKVPHACSDGDHAFRTGRGGHGVCASDESGVCVQPGLGHAVASALALWEKPVDAMLKTID